MKLIFDFRFLPVALGLFALLASGVQASPADSEPRIERLEDQVRALREELAELRRERAVAEARLADTEEEVGALSDVLGRVKLGGYGSVRFDASSLGDAENTFTFRRMVFTTDAHIGPRLRFYSELEYERFRKLELERQAVATAGGLRVEQEIEGTSDSEIAVEQAWLEFELDPRFRFRAGGVLVPLGRFNLNHDDNQWNLPRRSLVDRGVPVLPTTSAWDELGAGLAGRLAVGEGDLSYHLYVVNGVTLEAELEAVVQTRATSRDKLELEAKFVPQTGTFSNDTKGAKAVTGRLGWAPGPGRELAFSFYTGRYTPDFLEDRSVTSFALDGLLALAGFELEGELVTTHWGGVRSVAEDFARVALEQSRATPSMASPDFESEIEFELQGLAKRLTGYWVELRRPLWPAFLPTGPFENPELVPTLRLEQVWFNDRVVDVDFTGGLLTSLETEDRELGRASFGLAYRPTPLVVFSAAYEFTWTDSGESLSGLTNFLSARDDEDSAHALLMGASFGF